SACPSIVASAPGRRWETARRSTGTARGREAHPPPATGRAWRAAGGASPAGARGAEGGAGRVRGAGRRGGGRAGGPASVGGAAGAGRGWRHRFAGSGGPFLPPGPPGNTFLSTGHPVPASNTGLHAASRDTSGSLGLVIRGFGLVAAGAAVHDDR